MRAVAPKTNKQTKPLLNSRSQWPLGLRRGSAATRLLELWIRIPLESWMSVVMCVVRYRSLITRLEESYRLWCVVV
jgi:hypothetical protein